MSDGRGSGFVDRDSQGQRQVALACRGLAKTYVEGGLNTPVFSGIDLDVMRAKVQPNTVIRGETVPDGPTAQAGEPTAGPRKPSDPTVIKGEIEP